MYSSKHHLGLGAALPRHQTLRATLDSSYQTLSETEVAVLRRLANFAGSFSLETAEAVAASEEIPAATVVSCISNRVAKSLLVVEQFEMRSVVPCSRRHVTTCVRSCATAEKRTGFRGGTPSSIELCLNTRGARGRANLPSNGSRSIAAKSTTYAPDLIGRFRQMASTDRHRTSADSQPARGDAAAGGARLVPYIRARSEQRTERGLGTHADEMSETALTPDIDVQGGAFSG